MKRVALVSVHGCPRAHLGSRYAGGMSVYVLNLAKALGQLGLQVDVFTRFHQGARGEDEVLGENARLVHLRAGPPGAEMDDLFGHLPAFVQALMRFAESRAVTYNVIHSHYWLSGWVGNVVGPTWGVPHVATFHTLAELKLRAYPGPKDSALRMEKEREVVGGVDGIVAFSPHEKAMLLRHYGVPSSNVWVVPCGVDTSLFRPADRGHAREALGFDRDDKIALFVGRIDPLKGLDLLLESIAQMEDRRGLKVVIVGGNGAEDKALAPLRRQAAQLGIEGNVRFLGSVQQDQLPLYYSAADLCALPSYHESFGLVALEAMACGLPVVAARVGGLQTIVKHGETGYLVPFHCSDAFSIPIETVLGNHDLGVKLGMAARTWAEKMDWQTVAREMVEVYQGTAEELRASRAKPNGRGCVY